MRRWIWVGLKVSERYNHGLNLFAEELSFAAMYLAIDPEICLGEV